MNAVKSSVLLATLSLLSVTVDASDLYRLGGSPASLGSGSIAALGDDPLAAMKGNPALLSRHSEFQYQLSAEVFLIDASVITATGEYAEAKQGPVLVPELAWVKPLSGTLTFGAAVLVNSGMQASFSYLDPPGTGQVSYGRQVHEAEYLVGGLTAALAYELTDSLSLGVQAGLLYNRNRLEAPYIFQSHPALQGLKVLVDLDADDISPMFRVGIDYQISQQLGLSLAYSPQTRFSATGELRGNLAELGLGIAETFHYNAEVKTSLPGFYSAALVYQYSERLSLGVQLDQVHWSKGFEELPITLSKGSNKELNSFLKASSIRDTAPLKWDDQISWHVGGRYKYGNKFYRVGYEHSDVPVPSYTMTALTGAIFSDAVSAGLTLPLADSTLDLYYRFSFSDGSREVRDSILLAGEHNNTSLTLKLHALGIALSF